MKTFDTWGILSGAGFVIPTLIMMCQGSSLGSNSPITIVLIILIILCCSMFMYLGCKTRDVRPVIPFVLFRNPTIAAILVQNVLFGAAYYSFTYFVPLYLQVVRGLSPLMGSALFIPYFATHGIWSTISGLIVSYLQNRGQKSYSYVLTFGFCIWTLAMGVLAWYSSAQPPSIGPFIVFEILVGLGTGSTFQNSIMAIRAQVTAEHNAVAVSARNVLRFFGGALGIAVSSVVLEQRLKSTMPVRLEFISDSAFTRPQNANLTEDDLELTQHSYAGAIAWSWYVSTGMIGLCVLLCFLVKDNRKAPKAPPRPDRDLEDQTVEMARVPSEGDSDTDSKHDDDSASMKTIEVDDRSLDPRTTGDVWAQQMHAPFSPLK